MHFWVKFLHIAAMAVWFAGLFFVPRLLISNTRSGARADRDRISTMGTTLYFTVMTPAAAVTIVLGTVLLSWGFDGAWLPAKLILVTSVVLLHMYFGKLLLESDSGDAPHPVLLYRVLNWIPLFLLLALAALTAAKPLALPPLGGP